MDIPNQKVAMTKRERAQSTCVARASGGVL